MKCGYLFCGLSKEGKRKFSKIHRLVAMSFIDNPENKPEVNHIDGNKQNNYVENLEWMTSTENTFDAYKNGLMKQRSGKESICAKSVIQIDKLGNRIKIFGSIREAGRKLGISQSDIVKVCKRKYGFKTAGGFLWCYE